MTDMRHIVQQINAYTQLANQRELTEAEQQERQALREQYMALFRQRLHQQLDNTFVQKEDGTKVPLKDWPQECEQDPRKAPDR